MTNSTTKPTALFWTISIIALLWNIMGLLAYLGQAYMTDEALALLPDADQAYYANVPTWVTSAFAIAVLTGCFGSVALILKKRWAMTMFTISLIAVVIQVVYNLIIQDFVALSGARIILPLVTLVIAAYLVWFAISNTSKNILK